MGCDIECAVEIRRRGEAFWQFACLPDFGRCYDVFGLMAGVRGPETMFEPRGWPENVSSYTKHKLGEFCEHSLSHLTYSELGAVLDECRKNDEYEYTYLAATLAYMSVCEIEGYESRLVFGFNS